MKLRIGIDIGSKGAIAFFRDGQLSFYAAFPRTEDRPDLRAFTEMFLEQLGTDLEDVHAAIEDLHSIHGAGAASNFSFGWINGATEMLLSAFSIPYTKVGPKKWQKQMWEGVRPVKIAVKTKKSSAAISQEQWNALHDLPGIVSDVPQTVEETKHKVDTKATSLLAAQRLFPGDKFLATPRSKVAHDGIVDAVLIGLYCSRNF